MGEINMKIILASGSPRRKELLKLVIPQFDIMISGVDEKIEKNLTVEQQVTKLSYIKAKDIYDKTDGDRIIIGADTIVVKNNKIYGKPKNKEDAKQIIKELLDGDRTHRVLTGLTIIYEKDGEYQEYKLYDEAKIFLKNITDEEIEKWIATGNAMDKAGAYGIQNEFCVHVEKVEGNYMTVLGLPVHKLYDIIKGLI